MKTLEERVESSAIRNAFLAVMATRKINLKSTIYWLVSKKTGITRSNVGKIVRNCQKTGPTAVLEYLTTLRSELSNGKHMLTSIHELANELLYKRFVNQRVLTDFLMKQLSAKQMRLKKATLQELLFYHKREYVWPWHYEVYDTLKRVKSGEITVDKGYLKKDFETYQKLLWFAYRSLNKKNNLSTWQFAEFMQPILNVSYQTIRIHMYKKPKKGKYSKPNTYHDKLIDYILGRILVTVDIANGGKLRGSDIAENSKVLMLLDKSYSDEAINYIMRYMLYKSKEKGFQIAFVFDPSKIEQAILSLKPTCRTAYQANRSL